MQSKLNLNGELVDRARQSAANIAKDTQDFIDQHTTVTVERAVCRLLGIDGVFLVLLYECRELLDCCYNYMRVRVAELLC